MCTVYGVLEVKKFITSFTMEQILQLYYCVCTNHTVACVTPNLEPNANTVSYC